MVVAERSGAVVDDARGAEPGGVAALNGLKRGLGLVAWIDLALVALEADPGSAEGRQVALLEFVVGEAGGGSGNRCLSLIGQRGGLAAGQVDLLDRCTGGGRVGQNGRLVGGRQGLPGLAGLGMTRPGGRGLDRSGGRRRRRLYDRRRSGGRHG